MLELLEGGAAHVDYDSAVAKLPAKLRGAKPAGQPHTPWRLIEHMRITQRDILEFSRNPKHVSPAWPEGYWPAEDGPAGAAEWNRSVREFHADRRAMVKLVADARIDLLKPFAHGQGQTLSREAMLLADHTGYHLGQLVLVCRLLGVWTG